MSGSEAERRQWPRIPAALLSNVSAAIMAGPDVKLVNLSRGGALMEVAARYPMRSKVRLKLTRPGGEVTQINGTVSWAKVASISNGKINYLLAVIFETAVDDLAAVTGIPDVENHASATLSADPFFDSDDTSAVIPAQVMAPVAGSAPVYVEEDLSPLVFPGPRGVLAAFPTPATAGEVTSGTQTADAAAVEFAEAEAKRDALRRELERATADLAGLSAANDNLSAQLQAYDDDRIRLRSELEAARLTWNEEKSALISEAGATLARLEEIQRTLTTHQQTGGQAIAEQQALAEALSARIETLEAERATLRAERTAERQQWDADRETLTQDAAAALGRAGSLQEALTRRERDTEQALAAAATFQLTVQSRIEALESERLYWTSRLETERRTWSEERSRLTEAVSTAAAQVAAIEAALQQREADHREAMALAGTAQALAARTEELATERDTLAATRDREREAWQTERAELVRLVADAEARIEGIERTFQSRQEEQALALAEQQALALALRAQLDSVCAELADVHRVLDLERHQWSEDNVRLAGEIDGLRAELAGAQQTLAAERGEWSHERTLVSAEVGTLRDEFAEAQRILGAERAGWAEERARLADEISARTEEFQAALEGREQVHAETLTETQARYEGLIAELMQAANDQQAEYQQLVAERTVALEEQVSRVERVQAELARVRSETEAQRTAMDVRCRELEARVEAAEAISVAHETRHRAIRTEAERLVSLLVPAAPDHTEQAAADDAFTASGDSAQAVAGG